MSFQADDRDRSMAAFESLRKSVVFLVRSDDHPTRRAVDDLAPKEDFMEFFHALQQKYPSCRKRIGEVLKALSVSEEWAMVLREDSDFCAEYGLSFSPCRSQGVASLQSCTPDASTRPVSSQMEAGRAPISAKLPCADPWCTSASSSRQLWIPSKQSSSQCSSRLVQSSPALPSSSESHPAIKKRTDPWSCSPKATKSPKLDCAAAGAEFGAQPQLRMVKASNPFAELCGARRNPAACKPSNPFAREAAPGCVAKQLEIAFGDLWA